MFFHLPNLLETFSAKLARQLFLVNFTLLSVVNMFDMSSDVVRVEEALSAYFTRIVAFSSMRFLRKVRR